MIQVPDRVVVSCCGQQTLGSFQPYLSFCQVWRHFGGFIALIWIKLASSLFRSSNPRRVSQWTLFSSQRSGIRQHKMQLTLCLEKFDMNLKIIFVRLPSYNLFWIL